MPLMHAIPSIGTLRGLGQTEAPGWCKWAPFADWMDACKIQTKAEIEAENKAQALRDCQRAQDVFGCAKRLGDPTGPCVSVEECAMTAEEYTRRKQQAASRSTPEAQAGACQAAAVEKWPTIARVLGPSAVCDLDPTIEFGGSKSWMLAAGAAVGVLFLVVLLRR